MILNIAQVAALVVVARDLTEKDEPNEEYIRGQVNLLTEAAGLIRDDDRYHELLMKAIKQEVSMESFLISLVKTSNREAAS